MPRVSVVFTNSLQEFLEKLDYSYSVDQYLQNQIKARLHLRDRKDYYRSPDGDVLLSDEAYARLLKLDTVVRRMTFNTADEPAQASTQDGPKVTEPQVESPTKRDPLETLAAMFSEMNVTFRQSLQEMNANFLTALTNLNDRMTKLENPSFTFTEASRTTKAPKNVSKARFSKTTNEQRNQRILRATAFLEHLSGSNPFIKGPHPQTRINNSGVVIFESAYCAYRHVFTNDFHGAAILPIQNLVSNGELALHPAMRLAVLTKGEQADAVRYFKAGSKEEFRNLVKHGTQLVKDRLKKKSSNKHVASAREENYPHRARRRVAVAR